MLCWKRDAKASGGKNLMGSTHGGGMEVVVEGIGPEEDLGGFVGQHGTAVFAATGVAGETAIGGEGFCKTRKGSLWVDVKDFFNEGTDDRSLVDGIDEIGGEGCQACEDIDTAEGIVREWTGVAFIVMSKKLGFVGGHVDGDRTLGFAGFAGETEVEGFFDLLIFPLAGEDFTLHQLP